MLNIFKGYFTGKSTFLKQLSSSSLMTNNDEVVLDDLLFLILSFEKGHDPSSKTPVYYIDEYFRVVLQEYLFCVYNL